MNEKTAIIYARVSTQRQAEEELPIDSQIERCRKKAEELGARVVRIFTDAGRSGREADRPEFQAAIAYCMSRQVDYFITWSTSRFARNIYDAILYKKRLRSAGVQIQYVTCDMDADTLSGFMLERSMEMFDEALSIQVSEDTKRSMIQNARNGYWNGGHVPFGYEPCPAPDDPKRKTLRIREDEAEVVRRAFAMRVNGIGATNIARALNDDGITNRGKRWHKGTVAHMLRSHAVVGENCYGKRDRATGKLKPKKDWTIVPAWEPIVDRKTWETVQTMMDRETKTTGRRGGGNARSRWLFTGLLECAKCGASMQIESSQRGKYSYYNCRANQKHGACERNALRADKLDEYLVDVICARIFTEDNLRKIVHDLHEHAGSWVKRRDKEIAGYQREIAKLQRSQQNILETIEAVGPHGVDPTVLMKRTADIQDRIDDLEGKIEDLMCQAPPEVTITERDTEALAEFLRETIMRSKHPAKMNSFFASFIDRIVVGKKNVTIYYKPECLVTPKPKALPDPQYPEGVVWLPGTGSNRRPSD